MDHVCEADERQAAIYRQMTPQLRLRSALKMNARMRALMDAGIRRELPHLSKDERKKLIAQRILHARTG